VLRENLIRLAVVDFLPSAAGTWDHNLMAPSGLPYPHWHGSIRRLLGGRLHLQVSECDAGGLALEAFSNLSLIFPGLPDGGQSPSLEVAYPVSKTLLSWYPTNPRWFNPPGRITTDEVGEGIPTQKRRRKRSAGAEPHTPQQRALNSPTLHNPFLTKHPPSRWLIGLERAGYSQRDLRDGRPGTPHSGLG
jgi:hypothetical protein